MAKDNEATPTPKKRGASRLGKGLSSLIGKPVSVTPVLPQDATPPRATPSPAAPLEAPAHRAQPDPPVESAPPSPDGQIVWLSLDQITPNPNQPRKHFDVESLNSLADSIRQAGLMQPIVVTPLARSDDHDQGSYQIVAGERRWRAAQIASLDSVPAIVRKLDAQQIAEWALIENLQREDLNPIERAEAFDGLIKEHQLSHEQVAMAVGVKRSTVTNSLRLLTLCDYVRDLIRAAQLSAGQAKAIAGLADPIAQEAMAQRAVRKELSVRQLEELVRKHDQTAEPAAPTTKTADVRATHFADLEAQIAQQLSTKAKIRPGRKKGSGTLSIEFYSVEQFDTLMAKLGVELE